MCCVCSALLYAVPSPAMCAVQVDLSDDAVVAQLFASGAWFDVMEPLEVRDACSTVLVFY